MSRENQLSFQLGLIEREINEILHGNHTQKQQTSDDNPTQTDQSDRLVRREITGSDVCPICQEEFAARALAITYCKFGCGQNVHVRCIKIWADHQKMNGDITVTCPVCRSAFAPLKVSL